MAQLVCNMCLNIIDLELSISCSTCSNVFHVDCLNFDRSKHEYPWFCGECMSRLLSFNHLSDDLEFMNVLLDRHMNGHDTSSMGVNYNVFENFSQVTFSTDGENALTEINDPDNQYYNELLSNLTINCEYYTEDSFIKKMKLVSTDKTKFSLLHLNVRSIPKNFNNFLTYLETLQYQFSVIGISETWLKDHNVNCYFIDGYKSEHNYRKEKAGGGVSLFVKSYIDYIIRNDLTVMNSHIETLFIELPKCNISDKNVIIGVIYRPPNSQNSQIDLFNETMNNILDKLRTENKICYLWVTLTSICILVEKIMINLLSF